MQLKNYEVKSTYNGKLWHHLSWINAYSKLDAYLIAVSEIEFVEKYSNKWSLNKIKDWILKEVK